MKSIFALLLAGVLVLSACDTNTAALPTDEAQLSVLATTTTITSVIYAHDFEDGTGDWNDVGGVYGTVSHNAGVGTGQLEGVEGRTDFLYGPYSFFGSNARGTEWPGDYVAEIQVYLDTTWEIGEGFDLSVASWNTAGAHRRDFIIHVGVVETVDGKELLVNGSNNSDWKFNQGKLLNQTGGANYTVTTSGWYTVQHSFRDDGGVLAVDLNLLNSDGTLVWSKTRKDDTDLINTTVGANGYQWFVYISVDGGIEVDNQKLYQLVDLLSPETKAECMKGGWQTFGFKNQGQCIRYVNTGKDSR